MGLLPYNYCSSGVLVSFFMFTMSYRYKFPSAACRINISILNILNHSRIPRCSCIQKQTHPFLLPRTFFRIDRQHKHQCIQCIFRLIYLNNIRVRHMEQLFADTGNRISPLIEDIIIPFHNRTIDMPAIVNQCCNAVIRKENFFISDIRL